MHDWKELFEIAAENLKNGKKVTICIVVEKVGSAPQEPGAIMLVDEYSNTFGTIGGGCIEGFVRKKAFELQQTNTSELVDFSLDVESSAELGMICGGSMKIAIETLYNTTHLQKILDLLENYNKNQNPKYIIEITKSNNTISSPQICYYELILEHKPHLIIAGGGHISLELAYIVQRLDFDITVIDNRADYANSIRFPPPIKTIVGDFKEVLQNIEINSNSYIVIVTRGHKYDEIALETVINRDARYIGMIGSQRKVKAIFENLEKTGISKERISKVYAPIGLKIGARTVAEIAVSIAAQMIQVRRSTNMNQVFGPFYK